jgi:hypothetical protein
MRMTTLLLERPYGPKRDPWRETLVNRLTVPSVWMTHTTVSTPVGIRPFPTATPVRSYPSSNTITRAGSGSWASAGACRMAGNSSQIWSARLNVNSSTARFLSLPPQAARSGSLPAAAATTGIKNTANRAPVASPSRTPVSNLTGFDLSRTAPYRSVQISRERVPVTSQLNIPDEPAYEHPALALNDVATQALPSEVMYEAWVMERRSVGVPPIWSP